jgi:uncharacterized protein (DUF305 family)
MKCVRTPAALVWVLAWCVCAVSKSSSDATADEPAPHPQQRRFEIRFLEDMIDHHHMAVMMAEMCMEKELPHLELTEMCESIATAQMAEIEQMHAWLEAWYGREHGPEMTRPMERDMEALAELDGEEFEIEFMQMMIKHHKQAVRAGRQCVRRADHEDLITLCQDIVESQSAEIEQMESWLCEWYEICNGHQH